MYNRRAIKQAREVGLDLRYIQKYKMLQRIRNVNILSMDIVKFNKWLSRRSSSFVNFREECIIHLFKVIFNIY